MGRPSTSGNAFTLIEVMCAAAILAIIGGGVFTSMVRLQRHASVNRNYACAQILLRNAADQALNRGWIDVTNPNGILAPTIPGSSASYDATSAGWSQWNPFTASDTTDPNSTVPVYTDQIDATRNVNGRLYRKVQRVQNNERLLWIGMRVDYLYAGKAYSQKSETVRALD